MDKIDEAKRRKAVNFDLSTSELRKIFGYSGTSKAYDLIKKFMLKHGFEHRQYSGYISKKPMSFTTVIDLIQELSLELPWLSKTIKRMDVTSVLEDTLDLVPLIKSPIIKQKEDEELNNHIITNTANEIINKAETLDTLDKETEALINDSSIKEEYKEVLFSLIEDYKNNNTKPEIYQNVKPKNVKKKAKNHTVSKHEHDDEER